MQERIVEEIKEAGMFAVQIDTTMDVSCHDQCSVITRYVTDVVHERLVAVINCEEATGEYFVQLFKKIDRKFDSGSV